MADLCEGGNEPPGFLKAIIPLNHVAKAVQTHGPLDTPIEKSRIISGDLGGHVMKHLSLTPARPIQRSDIYVFRYECPVTVASMKKKGPYSFRCDNAQKTFTFGESRSCSMIL
ncbi:hypothetical protein ANN_22967 [Periplaneta americana]|uniref:Uncharacterized protein n=1 Tax=Periplaneta americana TaxID=6978 RepID=A0ABQ8SL10_PERAM|nr:hypothetical protein ANN_22967 [Periplaneta americana]